MVNECSSDPATPKFSMIFLTWNSENDVERTLNSVINQSYSDFEIIVVDNNSHDQTVQILEENYLPRDNIRVVENESNLGFTGGINRGIEAAKGQYICCYNDDTYFPEDYLQTLTETISEDAVWTTARINHRVSTNQRTVRLLTWHRFPIPYVVDSLSGVVEVNYVPGDGLIIPRRIYEEELDKQVFDPEMPDKGEDLDLSLRLRNNAVPLKAVLDTYSTHPDEGFYSPSLNNACNHLANVYARYRAYRKNEFGVLVLGMVLASIFTVPIEIFLRTFPRGTNAFKQLVQ